MVFRINASRAVEFRLWNCIAHSRGSNRAISKSNSRKVIATRKNLIEKDNQAEFIRSNLHS